jgi:hypothetical protein
VSDFSPGTGPSAARSGAGLRPGATLVEVLAAMTLAGLAGTLVCGMLLSQLRLARNVAERAATADAVRVALAVLDGELRRSTAMDVRALSPDSLALRSFRGAGLVCRQEGGAVIVRYRGDRLPDARKDSVLLLGEGPEQVHALEDVRTMAADSCAAGHGEVLLRMRLTGIISRPVIALAFESGHYYLTARALRYRLGAEGRQPITPELFVHPATRFEPAGASGLPVRLRTLRGDTVDAILPLLTRP